LFQYSSTVVQKRQGGVSFGLIFTDILSMLRDLKIVNDNQSIENYTSADKASIRQTKCYLIKAFKIGMLLNNLPSNCIDNHWTTLMVQDSDIDVV
jgi:hypothetical protein